LSAIWQLSKPQLALWFEHDTARIAVRSVNNAVRFMLSDTVTHVHEF
jgi:hypothetical protein